MNMSCIAMLCGWIACNITMWVTWLPGLRIHFAVEGVIVIIFLAFCTGGVISAAWFLIFLPVDLVVPDASPLRRPGVAAFCGFLVSFALAASFLVCLSPYRI